MYKYTSSFNEGRNEVSRPFKCYVMQTELGGVTFSGKNRYEGVKVQH